MSIDLYRLSVGTFQRHLEHIDALLSRALTHCAEHAVDPQELLSARLAPDMFDFKRQVQIACDFAKGTGARLAGVEVPKYEDDEKSFEDLRVRVNKTMGFLRSLAQADFVGADTRTVVIPLRDRTLRMDGATYLVDFALPNFYFHYTTAYDLLRHKGVAIGKRDFIGDV
ncbi:DUF1993 domain-containing protein [Niveibacterium umoris]|uniref:DUF1993 domain-containing protein n=1 Tax=Niveibacterium umoris TaxID=1193620 RepID=A0A840BHR4_9RHOO|nr:DUF1993 domain-containing protein [Niveibacterium umoris]MBB4011824.1 hypothetical protein [Niveibacterium umoris]